MSTDLTLLAILQIAPALLGIGVAVWLVGGWINRLCTWVDRHVAAHARHRELERLRELQAGREQMAQMFDCKKQL